MDTEAAVFLSSLKNASAANLRVVEETYGGADLTVELPPLGEGDRGIVYRLAGCSLLDADVDGDYCVKIAKPQAVSRQRLLEEVDATEYYLSRDVVVPRIHYMDPEGRFCIKEFVDGESITSLYLRLKRLSPATQRMLLEGLDAFLTELLELFQQRPDFKVSISPNNIYLRRDGDRFRDPPQFVLIDPGPTLKKSYDGFSFHEYWNEVLPDRIKKYRRTGYLQWLVPHEVTESERDDAKDFSVFRDLQPSEIFVLLKAARTVEFDPGEVILREGAIGESFFLVLEGEVEARRGDPSDRALWSLRIGRGSVLGEMGFLLGVPRSMTLVAATACKLIEIEREPFDELLAANLTAPYKLIKNIAVTLAERLHALDTSHERLLENARHRAR